MLGEITAACRSAPAHPAGFDGAAQGLSKAVFGRDVFRLRRRIFDCRFAGGRAGRIQSQRSYYRKMSFVKQVVVSGGFDDIRSRDLRFLDEAARLGKLTVLLWNDQAVEQFTGMPPKFPLAERNYV